MEKNEVLEGGRAWAEAEEKMRLDLGYAMKRSSRNLYQASPDLRRIFQPENINRFNSSGFALTVFQITNHPGGGTAVNNNEIPNSINRQANVTQDRDGKILSGDREA